VISTLYIFFKTKVFGESNDCEDSVADGN